MNIKFKGVLFLGFGGHARSVADVAIANGIESILFVDDNAKNGETFAGFPVIKNFPKRLLKGWIAFPASGEGLKRQVQLEDIQRHGWVTGNIISSKATVSVFSQIGIGCFVGNHSHIGPKAKIGNGCIVNTGAKVEHDSFIGDYAHISVNSTIAGGCKIGAFCFIGAGATVIDGVDVSDNVTLGAGGCFIKNVSHPGVYVGVPAVKNINHL